MLHIDNLELRTATAIRKVLRNTMEYIDINYISDPIHECHRMLERSSYDIVYKQTQLVYKTGYKHAAGLVHAHFKNSFLSAATMLPPTEDPRIAAAVHDAVFGLHGTLDGHNNEIQAALRRQYEIGGTADQISSRIREFFDDNRMAADRFARTMTNDVYNRAHLDQYTDSGIVDGVIFSAHIDDRTSPTCLMMNGTIWSVDDRDIQVPPLHFNCRSAILPYWGGIPGKRDFTKDFDAAFIERAESVRNTFRNKYWGRMKSSKVSGVYQRRYVAKPDIKVIDKGLSAVIMAERAESTMRANEPAIKSLRDLLRYRRIEADKTIIADAFGKSILLDKIQEREIIKGIKTLIRDIDTKIAKIITKKERLIANIDKKILSTHKSIVWLSKDALAHKEALKRARAMESYLAQEHITLMDAKLSADKIKKLEADKKEYEALLLRLGKFRS